jgi:pyrroloquinoline quinone biosynthesis protein B
MSRLRLIVLGSAAGGGLPQWNCAVAVSRAFWSGDPRVAARTQSSVAVSAKAGEWVLLNCSPDIRQQVMATRELWPVAGTRRSPISAAVLTNADVDHVGGLLTLRERHPFKIMATRNVLSVLEENCIFNVVDRKLVPRVRIAPGEEVDAGAGVRIEVFPVPGKVPLYLESAEPDVGAETEDTVGVRVAAGSGPSIFYIPGCARLSESLRARLAGAELVLFDGTLWRDDEMIRAGVGEKTGRRMGHMSMSGPEGTIAAFADLAVKRKVFIHINNTNPVLVDGSPERGTAEAAGWEIGFDGMEMTI